MATTYRYEQHFTVVRGTTVGAMVENQRAKLVADEPYEGLYMIFKPGEYPVRVESQWAWLRRQQPSIPVTLLTPYKNVGSYEPSADTYPMESQPLVS